LSSAAVTPPRSAVAIKALKASIDKFLIFKNLIQRSEL
jgi:hypothetical protein